MINSFLLMASQYNNKWVSNIFKTLWLLYTIVSGIFNHFNPMFLLINLSAFILVTGLIKSCQIIDRKFYNTTVIFSILAYSVFIDTICYFALPKFVPENLTLLGYILNGISFNFKYIVFNALAYSILGLLMKFYNKSKHYIRTCVHIAG